MLSLSFFALLGASAVVASPIKRAVDNTQPAGTNPLTVTSSQLLGPLVADNSCSQRDLGFTGKLGGDWYAFYGDTLWCQPGVTDPATMRTDLFSGMVRNSLSKMTSDALIVEDMHLESNGRQAQFIPFVEAWGETMTTIFWGTSLCETNAATGQGIIYFIKSQETDVIGSGASRVEMVNGQPTAVERQGTNGIYWNAKTHARYGDVIAYRDVNSDYIYLYGWAPTSVTDTVLKQYIFAARVNHTEAFQLDKYEYYWGREQGWKSELLNEFTAETAVLWGTGQSQIVYNEYYKTYVLVGMAGTNVNLQTAPTPAGPWSKGVNAYNVTNTFGDEYPPYAGVAHPWLDESGKTLTVSYTNYPNKIEVVQVNFA